MAIRVAAEMASDERQATARTEEGYAGSGSRASLQRVTGLEQSPPGLASPAATWTAIVQAGSRRP
jgi:hypothetical protein